MQVEINARLEFRRHGAPNNRRLLASHQALELTRFLVIGKQFPGQRTLVTQHVDEKSQCAKAIDQLVKNATAGRCQIHVGDQERLNAVAHAQRSDGRLIETQNRKNAPHLGELTGYLMQRLLIHRAAEKRIQ